MCREIGHWELCDLRRWKRHLWPGTIVSHRRIPWQPLRRQSSCATGRSVFHASTHVRVCTQRQMTKLLTLFTALLLVYYSQNVRNITLSGHRIRTNACRGSAQFSTQRRQGQSSLGLRPRHDCPCPLPRWELCQSPMDIGSCYNLHVCLFTNVGENIAGLLANINDMMVIISTQPWKWPNLFLNQWSFWNNFVLPSSSEKKTWRQWL